MYREVFPSRLKEARNMSGFTQDEVAREVDTTQINISRYETGDREPDIETIGRLAEFYGVSIDWLFGLGSQGRRPNYDKINVKNGIGIIENNNAEISFTQKKKTKGK